MINKDGGDTAVMRGDIELMGGPPSPPTRENPVNTCLTVTVIGDMQSITSVTSNYLGI